MANNSDVTYKKVMHFIQDEIREGRYTGGQKIPSELELAKMFKTSRNTANKALSKLKDSGVIYRQQGKGSFANPITTEDEYKGTRPKLISLMLPFSQNDNTFRINEKNIIRGAESFLGSKGYYLTVNYTDDEISKVRDVVNKYKDGMSAGIIAYVSTLQGNLPFIYDLLLEDYPIVFLDKVDNYLEIPCVRSNNEKGGYEAVKYLISRGYEDIYFISDIQINLISSVKDRFFGYCKAIKESHRNIDERLIISGYTKEKDEASFFPYHEKSKIINDMISEILNISKDKRIGIFAENDSVAYTLILGCLEMNVNIPDKIGIIGFDDTDISDKSIIPITTVKQNFFDIGMLAAKSIVDKIEKIHVERDMVVDVELVPKASTL